MSRRRLQPAAPRVAAAQPRTRPVQAAGRRARTSARPGAGRLRRKRRRQCRRRSPGSRAPRRRGVGRARDSCWIIGDTPRDLACTRALGLRSALVATGRYRFESFGARPRPRTREPG
ncbi:HAD hydrolase-like protein [Actinoplanes sp. KI2]|uniref:HAD hydrolase-like protein n=1 Tax=Actinoplanes sp. KI2 TaxID=2983315 RepID=UPI0039833599